MCNVYTQQKRGDEGNNVKSGKKLRRLKRVWGSSIGNNCSMETKSFREISVMINME